jgi:hypothetical protein
MGKSTLAAAFSARGHSVLADDICIIDANDEPSVLPSTPRLRLWLQALDHFGIPSDGLPRALSRSEKYLVSGHWTGANEQRLVGVISLSRGACRQTTIHRLSGWRSFNELQSVVHMFAVAGLLGLGGAIFTELSKMVNAGVAIWKLSIPDDLVCLDEAVQKVSDVVRSYADVT